MTPAFVGPELTGQFVTLQVGHGSETVVVTGDTRLSADRLFGFQLTPDEADALALRLIRQAVAVRSMAENEVGP